MEFSQDILCYALISSLALGFCCAMVVYMRSTQVEPEQPLTGDGSQQNKRKIRKKEKAREKQTGRKNSLPVEKITTDKASEDSSDGPSLADPLGLGIDPIYAPKSVKKHKSVNKNKPSTSRQNSQESQNSVPEAGNEVPVVTSTPTFAPVDDVIDSAPTNVITPEEQEAIPQKDDSTDSGLNSDAVVEPVIEPVVSVAPVQQKKQKNKPKDKKPKVEKAPEPVFEVKTVAESFAATSSDLPVDSGADLPVQNDAKQAPVVIKSVVERKETVSESKDAKKKSKKKARTQSETGNSVLEEVLELVDSGYYSPETVQRLISALTDYGQSGATQAWKTMNDPEEKYFKQIRDLEARAENNEKLMVNQTAMIASLRSEIHTNKKQSERSVNDMRKELDNANYQKRVADEEIRSLKEKVKKYEQMLTEFDGSKHDKDKFVDELTEALNQVRNDLVRKESELEEINIRFRNFEMTQNNDFEMKARDFEQKKNQEIVALKSQIEAEKNRLLMEKDKEVQHVSKQLGASQDTVAELNARLQSERTILNDVHTELEALKLERAALLANKTELEAQLGNKDELQELEKSFRKKENELQKSADEKDSAVKKITEELEATKKKSQEEVKELKKQLESANKTAADSEVTQKNIKQVSDRLVKELGDTKARNSELEAELKKTNVSLEEVRKQKAEAVSKLASVKSSDSSLESLQKEKADALAKLETAQKQKSEVENLLKGAQNDKADVLKQIEAMKYEKSEVERQLKSSKKDCDEAEKKLETLKKESSDAVNRLRTVEKEKTELEIKLEATTKSHQNELSAIQKKYQDVEKKLDAAQKQPKSSSNSPTPALEEVIKQKDEIQKRFDVLSKKYADEIRSNFELKKSASNPASPVPSPSPSPVPPKVDEQQSKLNDNIEAMNDRVNNISQQITQIGKHISEYLNKGRSAVAEVSPSAKKLSDKAPLQKDGIQLIASRVETISQTIHSISQSLASATLKVPVTVGENNSQVQKVEQLEEENSKLKSEINGLQNTINKLSVVAQMEKHSTYYGDETEDQAEGSSSKAAKSKKSKKNGHAKVNGSSLDINGN